MRLCSSCRSPKLSDRPDRWRSTKNALGYIADRLGVPMIVMNTEDEREEMMAQMQQMMQQAQEAQGGEEPGMAA